jgi:hypothetical protein
MNENEILKKESRSKTPAFYKYVSVFLAKAEQGSVRQNHSFFPC